ASQGEPYIVRTQMDALGYKQYKSEDIQELFRDLLNDVQNIHEELAEYINTPSWNRHVFYNNDDDDDEDCTIAITPKFSITDSLSMGDEHRDTIFPATESNKFIKSSVENHVPIPSDSEDECECDVPDCDDSQTINFSTFSNPLFDDSTSSDDESSHEEDIHEMSFKTYSNPLFDLDEEIISTLFLESYSNRDTLMSSPLKIDSLLAEFVGALIFLKSIPPGIDEADCNPEEDIHLVERLLYDNSSPHPPEEIVSDNSNVDIESFSPSPIPNKNSDSHMEEIDLPFTPDDPMPPGIKEEDYDSIFFHLIILLQNHQMEKYPNLLPHQGLEAFQPSAERPKMIINRKNTPLLDVPLFHFYPP
nr:hypothetical protein [Tanacetum cinerariifolium]